LNGANRAHIILSVGKHHRHVAEIVVHWQDRSLTSKADTTDMYASALQAIDKLHKQGVKVKGKIIDRKHHAPAAKVVAPSPLPPVEVEKDANYSFAPLFNQTDDARRSCASRCRIRRSVCRFSRF
jgi:ribosome-associated translation inhibitor RaiA